LDLEVLATARDRVVVHAGFPKRLPCGIQAFVAYLQSPMNIQAARPTRRKT
jgi:hypothetical protein